MPIKIVAKKGGPKNFTRKSMKKKAPAAKRKTKSILEKQMDRVMPRQQSAKSGGAMKKKGMRRGGAMKSKGMAAGGKLKMVEKDGKKVPFFAADGKGKMAGGGRMKKKGMAGGGAMKKKGYAKGGKVTNVASLRKIAKDMGYTISKADGGMMKKKGMKKGGAMKSKGMARGGSMKRPKGGTVRGAGAATRGKRFGRAG